VSPGKNTTREKVLLLLRRKGPLTAQELGKELQISVTAIRQHILALEQASLVASRIRRQKLGRPGHEFVLCPKSEDAFPKVYKELASSMLATAGDIGGSQLVKKLVNGWRTGLHREYAEKLRDVPEDEKLACIARLQNTRGHLAHFEQGDHVQKLIQYNCVVHELSADYAAFCESERRMYEKLLGRPVKRVKCRAEGGDCCVFETCVSGQRRKPNPQERAHL
jgi:predicted ArsR family transcriptional regulator